MSTAGSFEAGVDGALAGIAAPGDPRPGMRCRQECCAGEAEDNGEVLCTSEMADVLEHKLHAPGIGPVLTVGISGGGGREELISVDRVPPGTGTGPLGSPGT
ncbi:MAG: hypothetical protein ACE5GB_07960 [Acidimicrobiales bacterium]